MAEKMRRLEVLVPEGMMKRIEEVAKEMGISKSVAVRLLLLAGLGEWKFEKSHRQAREVRGNEA